MARAHLFEPQRHREDGFEDFEVEPCFASVSLWFRNRSGKISTVIVALQLRPDAALGWLLDESAGVRWARVRALDAPLSSAQRWLELVEVARELCFDAVIEPAQLQRVALVFPGALDAQGRVRAEVAGFGGYDLRRGLHEHLHTDCEIVVASQAVADAWAQWHAGALRGLDDWLYLSLDGELEAVARARGAWLQPELGALVLERDGPLDESGKRGTLRAFCAPRAFEESARSYALNVAAREIWELSPSNFAAQSLAQSYISRLAQGLACAVAAFSPRRVCLGGELARALFARVAPDLASQLRDFLPPALWSGDLALAVAGEPDAIAPGVLALATHGAPPLWSA